MIKKDSLLKGTLILAAAALVARFLGLFQRIPFDYIFDASSGAYYSLSNQVYMWLLIIATAGIPSTISKMVSERYAQGRIAEAQQIYRAAILFGIVAGLIISCSLYLLAPYVLQIATVPGATLAIRAIAPALLLFPVVAMMRGYFQGRQMMSAGAISQIIEQVFRVISAVGLAVLFLAWGYNNERLAAGAAFGSVFGSVGAFIVMVWYARKLKRQDTADGLINSSGQSGSVGKLGLRTIYNEMFRLALPIVITAMTVQFVYMVDTFLLARMTGSYYTGDEILQVLDWFGIRAQPIAGIPPILAIALSQSIIPVISAAYATRNMAEVQRQGSLVMRIVLLTGVPAALTLTVAAASVTGSIFTGGTGGSGIVAALTAGTIFQITMMTSNSMLFGMGKADKPLKHTLIGFATKLIASLALAPLLGIYGMIIASTSCFLIITILNLRTIHQDVQLNVLGSRWLRYIAAVILTMSLGFVVERAGLSLLTMLPDKLRYILTAGVVGATIAVVYLVLIVILKVVTSDEVHSYPGPLRKLFSVLIRRLGRKSNAQGNP